ncbi:aldo/keto reductase [Luteolibacter pohnpeiensis]|uniref:Aldo/keto reductase n=1 Tax=Luteolibacter pohnpeiensis TaxID=454153 RepID=A0A934S2P4_9BACT|nr:aldo/keto reductase [Luteolibacter pohnpeiensis]MBK1881336.1 aldo/keto reductase [Luteolibacter pohnpeiensis]
MNLTTTAYGTWSGGRFMHYGETLSEERYIECIRLAYESGIRTFVTSDVYGNGKADELLGVALSGFDRESYCLVGMIGHDFYDGQREGNKGYPRFTNPALRGEADYANYLKMACEKSLARCKADRFDLVMLHNPDEIGYTSDAVWNGMKALKTAGLADRLGIAPGPANGFTLDLINCIEKYGEDIDWIMLILNPLEPWPTSLALPACEKYGVKVMTRVVDYGGVFHGDLKPGHSFKPGDHRAYRAQGWVEEGLEKAAKMLPLADKYNLTPLQFASVWNLSLPMVECVVPSFFEEGVEGSKSIDAQIKDFAALPDVKFTPEEIEMVRAIGDNTGCMALKGASKRYQKGERADEWPMREDLLEVAGRYELGTDW